MTTPNNLDWTVEPAGSIEELLAFLDATAAALRVQIDASQILAAPRLTSLRERLAELAEELDCLRAAMVTQKE